MSHTVYGPTEGPLGFPMLDEQAQALDRVLARHPRAEYTRLTVKAAVTDLHGDDRTDISWITTEAIDHHHEVVLASGMDDSHYRSNPIVTLDHNYWQPPIGRSLWRRKIRTDQQRGVQAKTHYPPRPDDHPREEAWPPDHAFSLIKSGLMRGKSIGFVTLDSREATKLEAEQHGWTNVRRVITKWLLVEYAATWLPANPEAIVEAVSKNLVAPRDFYELELAVPQMVRSLIPFTTLDEVQRMVCARLERVLPEKATESIRNSFHRAKGGI